MLVLAFLLPFQFGFTSPAKAIAPKPPVVRLASVNRKAVRLAAKKPLIKVASTAIAVGTPVRVEIPSIRVKAPIQPVGLLPEGKLDVPADRNTVGWYNLGPRPGMQGNAVLDGHLDIGKDHGIFWDLNKVKAGDKVFVTDQNGIRRTFQVRSTAYYYVDKAPMQQIFGDRDGNHLNIITCAGKWNTKIGHYEQRLIVYTDEIKN